jgi:hypothetical protein
MLESSFISQTIQNSKINNDLFTVRDVLIIYKNALKDMERILDKSDNSKISENDINILEEDLRNIILTLSNLSDNLNTELGKSVSRGKIHRDFEKNTRKSIRSIEQVKGKIRHALDELYVASNMLKSNKIRSFLRCFRNFQVDLSEASSAFILMEIYLEQTSFTWPQTKVYPKDNVTSNKTEPESPTSLLVTFNTSHYNTEAIRDLLVAGFDDTELKHFCFDYFREVYDKLTDTMDKPTKAQKILEYSMRNDSIIFLLKLIEIKSPVQYNKFKTVLIK